MQKQYTLIGGSELTITLRPNCYGEGYEVSAVIDVGPCDKEDHTHGANGGTLIDNMDKGSRWSTRQSHWWDAIYRKNAPCKTAAIARRVAVAILDDAEKMVGAAIARREAKLRLMTHILP
jgi:hypothetical protein